MNNKALSVFVIILSLVSVFSLYQNFQLKNKLAAIEPNTTKKDSTVTIPLAEEEEEFEVAPLMSRMQIYTNKLWYAGDAGNWDLATFYVEEIEEAMEEIEHSEAEENGVKLYEAVKEWGLGPLANLEKTIVSKDKKSFILEYDNLTINCNGCHTTAKHPYLKIIRPTVPIFTNQKYSLQ